MAGYPLENSDHSNNSGNGINRSIEDRNNSIEERLALHDEIRLKLRSINAGAMSGYRTRILKAGGFRHSPVSLTEPEMFTSPNEYLRTADEIAYLLTAFSEHWNQDFFHAVQHFIAMPELALSPGSLLTHIYDVDAGILAFYSYPGRFHMPESSWIAGRLGKVSTQEENGPGLLSSIARSVVEAHRLYQKNPAGMASSSYLHTYTVSAEILEPEEIRQMEDLEELRIGSFHYDTGVY